MAYYNKKQDELKDIFLSGKYTQHQRDKMFQIVEILGKYKIVDKDILNYAADGEIIDLKYILEAISIGLIVEFKSNKLERIKENFEGVGECDNNLYFYELGSYGVEFLELSKIKYSNFKFNDTYYEKLKVLNLNYNLMEHGYELQSSVYNDERKYSFYHCIDRDEQDVILYYEDDISKAHVLSLVKKRFVSTLSENEHERRHELFNEFISSFNFKSIEIFKTNYTDDLRAYEIDSSEIRYRLAMNDPECRDVNKRLSSIEYVKDREKLAVNFMLEMKERYHLKP